GGKNQPHDIEPVSQRTLYETTLSYPRSTHSTFPVSVARRWTWPVSREAVATTRPPGAKKAASAPRHWPCALPSGRSQRTASRPPSPISLAANLRPSAEKVSASAHARRKERTSQPVSASHTRTHLSSPDETSRRPSGAKARHCTFSPCASITRSSFPENTS